MRPIFSAGVESVLHAGLGAYVAVTGNNWVHAAYLLYVWAQPDEDKCPNNIVQGAEYALGYFGVLLLLQTYGGLQY